MRYTFLVLIFSTLAQAASLTPAQVKQMIREKGVKETVQQLSQNQKSENELFAGIASGETEWLEVASSLRAGTDAGTTESLFAALSEALAVSPDAVLAIVEPELPVEKICTIPFIEPSQPKVRKFVAQTTKALSEVKIGPHIELARQCSRRIKDTSELHQFTAKTLAASIKKTGAERAWAQMSDVRFEKLLNALYVADADWMRVSALLRPKADAKRAAVMDKAMGLSLVKRPEVTLSLLGKGYEVGKVCEASSEEDTKYRAEFVASVRKLLEPLAVGKFSSEAKACSASLESSQ